MLRRALPAFLLAASAAAAQAPVRLVIAFPPGGSTDLLGRLLAPRLSELLGAPVVPENRSGASGAVGAGVVAQAPADGSVLLLDSGGQAVNPHLLRGLSFDYVADFAAVTMLATLPLLLVARADLGVDSVEALLARLRREPALARYGSVGIGARTHLAMAALLRAAAIAGEHIPYRGGADQIAGLLRGDVGIGFTSPALAAPLLRAGTLRALAVSTAARVPQFPDLPALGESGLPAVEDWLALFAPARTPPAVVERVAGAAAVAMRDPALRPRLAELGLQPAAEGPAALARFLAADRAAMGALIATEGIRLDG